MQCIIQLLGTPWDMRKRWRHRIAAASPDHTMHLWGVRSSGACLLFAADTSSLVASVVSSAWDRASRSTYACALASSSTM